MVYRRIAFGWADPFSQPSFTQRQQDYSRTLRQPTVYTPQMVIDGAYDFQAVPIGSVLPSLGVDPMPRFGVRQ